MIAQKTKYIFVTGGVTSSLGKGIISSSLAKLLQARGLSVTILKLDPYINVDPGTLNPYEHGECYVTVDGAETDLDLGHYERFLNVSTSQANNVTTGQVYQSVINKERKGDYLGKTVQIIPHITDEIKRRIKYLGSKGKYDVLITEIGGTVGDIESLPYIESVRQLKWELDDRVLVVHLTLVPYLSAAGELKTKPTQHSVKMLLEEGVQPDVLVLRSEKDLGRDIRRKVALFCNVHERAVIQSKDVSTIYEVPLKMYKEKLDEIVLDKLNLTNIQKPELEQWKEFVNKVKQPARTVRIGLIGKYVELKDSYKSISEAFVHAGASNNCKVELEFIHSENLEEDGWENKLTGLKGLLVAPGFGHRGIEGKINAVKFARENDIAFFGICLGMQCAVIEFARNVLGLKDANSIEMDSKTPYPVIDIMEEQKDITNMGGTMRLGLYNCTIEKNSKMAKAYGELNVKERHRHRYEYNNEYQSAFAESGMIATGINPDSNLVEAMEITKHKWFVGVQFHPEYQSTVVRPHPLFVNFVQASLK
ncbi:MAG: CTP synthase [Bacteroidetes bacterium]|jgi:CTP synthase|nr:CTP synthase [Bacteroidota bacterium]MBT3750665.1 CTP synthase [Bacteroidota bacterium]MBT4409389.1 CTP synthase [Bacteroidota bacterium]MBT7094276.1 CTP synthase [Bacteroidota bacterium]MBT7462905.1 CTP synthase [Bacteroidota bacterium]